MYTITNLRSDIHAINHMALQAGITDQLTAQRRNGYVGLDVNYGGQTVTTGTAKHCYGKACEWLMYKLYDKVIAK